jgi:dolichyl-phosphate beta-glucosyltransferase
VIPAYNEAARIGRTLAKIRQYLTRKGYDYELIVVDDGSTDQTRQVVAQQGSPRTRVVTSRRNHGKGAAVRRGVLLARSEWILLSDADLSVPIHQLERLVRYLDDDVVIGSKWIRSSISRVPQPWHRQLSSRIFNLCVRLLVLRGIRDTQCGFKLFRREAARRIFPQLTVRGFGFDVEVLYLAAKYGYRIKEVPIVWLHHKGSKVRLLRDACRMFADLLRIRLNDRRGVYR